MNLNTELVTVDCPYCGERFDAVLDPSAGNHEYVEDCYVCCAPIVFTVQAEADDLSVFTRRENE